MNWSRSRFDEIVEYLKPFLLQTGFQPSKTRFVPVGAVEGVNLASLEGDAAHDLQQWYKGPTLVDLLGTFQLCD